MDNEIMNSPVAEENLEAAENQASEQGNEVVSVAETEENAQTDTENAQKAVKVTAEDAVKKLNDELKKYTGQGKGKMADLMVEYLKKRAEEDAGVAADIMQESKSLSECIKYVYTQARKQATGGYAVVSDEVVFEWGEDYYHKVPEKTKKPDGKAMAKKTAKLIDDANKKASEKKKAAPKAEKVPEPKPEKKPVEPKKEKKPKKESGVMDGQMDLFSMMGM